MISNLFLILFSLIQAACHKEKTVADKPADLKKDLIAIARDNHLPTLSVSIHTGNGADWRFDYKDPDPKVFLPSRYGIASSTKFISSLVVLHFAEEKKIGLDDRISGYINLPLLTDKIPWASSITIRNLLDHTSGIPDYTHDPSWITAVMKADPPATLEEKLRLIPVPDSSFRQGKFYYSNTNYVLLEKIIEIVSRQKAGDVFDAFCHNMHLSNTSFFRPAGLEQAFFSKVKNETADVSGWEENYGFEAAAYSTVEDMAVLLNEVFVKKTVIADSSLTQMMKWEDMGKFTIDYGFGQMNRYGLGLMQLKVKNRLFIGHSGGSLKYQSFVFIEPSTRTTIVLMTNGSGQNYNNVFFIYLLGKIMERV